MTDTSAYAELLNQHLPQCLPRLVAPGPGDDWIVVEAASLISVLALLRDHKECQFEVLTDLTVVDWLSLAGKKPVINDPRFEVVYHLLSLTRRKALTIKVVLSRPSPQEMPEIPSVSGLWESANWHEREAYDMFGVKFTGHPDLRRILCPEDWVGYPLRKDYEFPREYHGIRGQ